MISPSSSATTAPFRLLEASADVHNHPLNSCSQVQRGKVLYQTDALLYYLDRGFKLQFCVNTEALFEQRSFVFDLLLHSTPFRLATSAFGYHQKIIETPAWDPTDKLSTDAGSHYYSEALQAINAFFHLDGQNSNVGLSSYSTVALFSCLLQVLYIEVCITHTNLENYHDLITSYSIIEMIIRPGRLVSLLCPPSCVSSWNAIQIF